MDLSPGYRWATLALIAGLAVLRIIYLAFYCPLDLAPDEAYYWDWSRQLDWSYHSKGPLVAWLIRLSCECFGNTMLAVRLPAVVCGSLLLWGLFTLTRQIYQSDRLAFAVVALALTLPIIAAGSMLMTIDAPFICAWIWALVFAHRAVFSSSRWAWPLAGLCILLGVLAKHTMVLWVPSFALFLITTPPLRGQLRRPGFWLTTGIGALGGIPILLWNAANDWVMLKHAQSHAGFDEDNGIRWLGPLQYLGAQCAVLLGFWFVLWLGAMWRHRPSVDAKPESRFLWWMSAPTFVFFGLFAFKNGGGEANWPLTAYLSGMVLAAGWWVDLGGRGSRRAGAIGSAGASPSQAKRQELVVRGQRWRTAGTLGFAALGVMVIALMHEPTSLQPILLRIAGPATPKEPAPLRRVDPTCRLRGWRHLAAEVDRACAELRERGIEPIIVGERWTLAGELAFYCDQQPPVYCLGRAFDDRDCQYDLWRPNPVADAAMFRGRTFVVVGLDLERLQPAFDSLEPIRSAAYCEHGQPITAWSIAVAHGFRGWDLKQQSALAE